MQHFIALWKHDVTEFDLTNVKLKLATQNFLFLYLILKKKTTLQLLS